MAKDYKKQFRFDDMDIDKLKSATHFIKGTLVEQNSTWTESDTIRYILDLFCYENRIKFDENKKSS